MTDLILGIPTIRKHTHATVREYVANFTRHGHGETAILVADDGPASGSGPLTTGLAAVARDYPDTPISYLGEREKARYLEGLERAVPGASALLGPGYGGNRNWLLLASLGRFLMSVDDDIHPYGLFQPGPQVPGTILEGAYLDPQAMGRVSRVEVDLVGAYRSMLGRPAWEVVRDWAGQGRPLVVGSHLRDANTDLTLNVSLRPLQPATIELVEGSAPSGRIGIVQSFLSGDPDLDSKDLIWGFLAWGDGRVLHGKLPLRFVIRHCQPCLLDHDFRLTAAVLGLDNREGSIPFIPTRLRFEDYLLRLYSKWEGCHVGYCAAAQTHGRSMVNRNNIVADFVIEGLATIMKKLINSGLRSSSACRFDFEPRPALADEALRSLWRSLVAPLEDAASGVARRSPFWPLYRALVEKEALDAQDPQPFVAAHRPRLLAEYSGLLKAMDLWPRILDHAARWPVRPSCLSTPRLPVPV